MRIYLVRHGQSLSNIDKSLHKTMPDHAIGLSPQGVVDAQRAGQSFGTFQRDSDKHGIDTIIVVCHGVTLRAFVMMWCHKTPEWFEAEENPENGSVRLIQDADDLGYLPLRYSLEDEGVF